jgi:hypothetical protein
MGKGTKIALGCGCVVLLGGAVLIAVFGWGAYWLKGKVHEAKAGVEKMTAQSDEMDRYKKQADANPYAAPADGVITEPRFQKFIDVRKQVYTVYERYQAELQKLQKKSESATDKVTLSEVWSAGGTLAEAASAIRLEQMKGLAAVGMSESEYRDIQMAVYKSAWASESETASGQLPAEVVSEKMAEAGKQMGAVLEAARKQGAPGTEKMSAEDARKVQEEMAKAGQGAGDALRVPRANVELFRKHQAEIKKYAMNGLAFLGL